MKGSNTILFVLFLLSLFIYSFFAKDRLGMERYPWYVLPWKDLDSLSAGYVGKYEIQPDTFAFVVKDDAKRKVFILVDAWGLPLEESLFVADLSVFRNAKTFLHWRTLNQTKQVELLELNGRTENGLYFFGGDSLEYGRMSYIPELGFEKMVFCQKCSDEVMVDKIDSALSVEQSTTAMAWTTQSSREGDIAALKKSLKLIADLSSKHPKVKFIVQGTHRPILGTPETRRMYYPHWVPVVILN